MNERFKTLCKEAFTEAHESRIGSDGLIRSDGNPYIFYEKLAELIVFECVKIAVFKGDATTGKAIKEHFGAEQ